MGNKTRDRFAQHMYCMEWHQLTHGQQLLVKLAMEAAEREWQPINGNDVATQNHQAAQSNLRTGKERRKQDVGRWLMQMDQDYMQGVVVNANRRIHNRRAILSKPERDMLLS